MYLNIIVTSTSNINIINIINCINIQININTNLILSSVPRHSYGIAAGFVQFLRTSSTVTGIAIATAIITSTMVSFNVDSNLKSLSEGIDINARSAFVAGLRNTYVGMACLQLFAVIMSAMKTQALSER